MKRRNKVGASQKIGVKENNDLKKYLYGFKKRTVFKMARKSL